MKNNVITVVAYKPSGVHTVRCCVVDSWSSEHEIFCTCTPEEAVRWVADLRIKAHEQDQGEYEFTVMVDGLPPYGGIDSGEDEETWLVRDQAREAVEQGAELAYQSWRAEAKARAEQAERQRLAEQKRARQQAKRRELEQLEAQLTPESLVAAKARVLALRAELDSG